MCSCPWLYSPKFWARLAINFSRWPYWIECGGKVDAFIDSENTYALPAKIDAARFAGRRNKFRRQWNGHPSRKHARGFVGNPSRSKTALQGASSPSRATARGRDLQERR